MSSLNKERVQEGLGSRMVGGFNFILFGISKRIKRRMIAIGKNKFLNFFKMSENVLFFEHMHSKFVS